MSQYSHLGKKCCPKCGYANVSASGTCKNPEGCDQKWERKMRSVTELADPLGSFNAAGEEGKDYKKCPKCFYKNHIRSMKCQNIQKCDQRWDPIERDRPVTDGTEPSVYVPPVDGKFACGYTSDGGAFLWWPEKDEYIELTKKQADLLYFLFMGEERGVRNLKVP